MNEVERERENEIETETERERDRDYCVKGNFEMGRKRTEMK